MLLEIKDLKTYFFTTEGIGKPVDGISFEIEEKETMALVGESGCGKSLTAFSIMQLIPSPPFKIVCGEIIFKGKNLLKLNSKALEKIRGNEISMVFQEPMTSLNPVFTCGFQIEESIILHQHKNRKEAKKLAIEMLRQVKIPSPEVRAKEYPHQLSGGMKQRVMIAIALSCHPSLLIADEPTTALDVTVQSQILELLKELQEAFNLSILLITHDLAIIAKTSKKVAVMYAGKIVEYAKTKDIFSSAVHPYTLGLLESLPKLETKEKYLKVIPGTVPSPFDNFKGCRFFPRCNKKTSDCEFLQPELKKISVGHFAACINI